ncbi:hypothetical protein HD554DRAFT_2301368 [Boletus coccyginus]|nr:hypothetical protein HD554DRAFT_2301368 [Boletus coccyginus]
MTLLSLFMTSTGIFCFVPISQRLVESGIIPAPNGWRLRRLPSLLAPTFYAHSKEKLQLLLVNERAGHAWSEVEEYHQMQYSPPQIPLHSTEDALATDQQLGTPCASEWSAGIVSPFECSTTNSPLQLPSIDTFYWHESTSFVTQDTTLCESCNILLRQEIPPDHIPSVIRAFALFEAQERSPDVAFNECEVVALTNAFSMLRTMTQLRYTGIFIVSFPVFNHRCITLTLGMLRSICLPEYTKAL